MLNASQIVQRTGEVAAKMRTGEALRLLVRSTIRLVADPRPVAIAAIAMASQVSAEAVEATLVGFADVEWDDRGRVVGLGLSLRPTEQQIATGGRTLSPVTGSSMSGSAAFLCRGRRSSATMPTAGRRASCSRPTSWTEGPIDE